MTSFHSTDMTVKTCKRCLYRDDHPLGLVIDDDGICSGCRIHEEKDQLDWDHRWHELETLVAPYRSTDTRNYDCIVPVSGKTPISLCTQSSTDSNSSHCLLPTIVITTPHWEYEISPI